MDRSKRETFRSGRKTCRKSNRMAITDNIEKISDTVWESPSTYTDTLRSNRGRAFDHPETIRSTLRTWRSQSSAQGVPAHALLARTGMDFKSDQIVFKPRIRGYFSSRDISG